GIAFFLLPFAASFLVSFLLNASVDFLALLILIGKGALYWIAITFLLYALLYAFKGKDVRGKILSIMASYSLVYVFLTIGSLIILFLSLYLFGNFYHELITNNYIYLSQDEITEIIKEKVPSEMTLVFGLIVIALASLFTFAGAFSVVYYIGNAVKKTSFFTNAVFTIIFFAIVAGLSTYLVIF
ncbi:MAG: hypothetical protein QXZ13_01700, partial [Candidatus Diapherotrites archaeon]